MIVKSTGGCRLSWYSCIDHGIRTAREMSGLENQNKCCNEARAAVLRNQMSHKSEKMSHCGCPLNDARAVLLLIAVWKSQSGRESEQPQLLNECLGAIVERNRNVLAIARDDVLRHLFRAAFILGAERSPRLRQLAIKTCGSPSHESTQSTDPPPNQAECAKR